MYVYNIRHTATATLNRQPGVCSDEAQELWVISSQYLIRVHDMDVFSATTHYF